MLMRDKGWLPHQIDDIDPDVLDSYLASGRAEADHTKHELEKARRERFNADWPPHR